MSIRQTTFTRTVEFTPVSLKVSDLEYEFAPWQHRLPFLFRPHQELRRRRGCGCGLRRNGGSGGGGVPVGRRYRSCGGVPVDASRMVVAR